jgi:hypothetical protein
MFILPPMSANILSNGSIYTLSRLCKLSFPMKIFIAFQGCVAVLLILPEGCVTVLSSGNIRTASRKGKYISH